MAFDYKKSKTDMANISPVISDSYNSIMGLEKQYKSMPSYKTGGGGDSAIEGLSKMMGGSIPNPYEFSKMVSAGKGAGESPYELQKMGQEYGLKSGLMGQEYGLKGELMGQEYGLKDISTAKEYGLKDLSTAKEYGLKDKSTANEYGLKGGMMKDEYGLKGGLMTDEYGLKQKEQALMSGYSTPQQMSARLQKDTRISNQLKDRQYAQSLSRGF